LEALKSGLRAAMHRDFGDEMWQCCQHGASALASALDCIEGTYYDSDNSSNEDEGRIVAPSPPVRARDTSLLEEDAPQETDFTAETTRLPGAKRGSMPTKMRRVMSAEDIEVEMEDWLGKIDALMQAARHSTPPRVIQRCWKSSHSFFRSISNKMDASIKTPGVFRMRNGAAICPITLDAIPLDDRFFAVSPDGWVAFFTATALESHFRSSYDFRCPLNRHKLSSSDIRRLQEASRKAQERGVGEVTYGSLSSKGVDLLEIFKNPQQYGDRLAQIRDTLPVLEDSVTSTIEDFMSNLNASYFGANLMHPSWYHDVRMMSLYDHGHTIMVLERIIGRLENTIDRSVDLNELQLVTSLKDVVSRELRNIRDSPPTSYNSVLGPLRSRTGSSLGDLINFIFR
jgi:hypothetical protein